MRGDSIFVYPPHPEEYWVAISFRQDHFDLGAILANYVVSLFIAYVITRLGQKLLLMYRRLKLKR